MKQGLVVTSFGTSVPEALASIEAVERVLREAAAGYTVYEAFTSPTIRHILLQRKKYVSSLSDAMEGLYYSGITRAVVQPTHLLYGFEYDKLKAEAERFSDRFDQITVGKPLLASSSDILRFAEKLSDTHPRQNGASVVYMGHGTEHFANAVYPALQTALDLADRNDIRIGTVDGWPGLEDVVRYLKEPCRVHLLPLMLVAGGHARNDMAGNWKARLEAAGHSVFCEFTGLGELEWVQHMYRDRLLEVL